MKKKKYDVLVVGELNVDLILNKIDSFPEKGKEKLAKEMTITLGSSSAIFASNMSSLGASVSFLGKIGKDSFGDLIIKSLKKKNVSTEMIIQDKAVNTGATIVLNFDEDRANITYPGAMDYLDINDVTEEKLIQARHLHYSSFFLQPALRPDVEKMFKTAKELGLTTSLDLQWDPSEKWEFDYKNILPYVDIFLPNEVELLSLTGENNLNSAIIKLKLFANTIVAKMGNQGSLLWLHKKTFRKEAFINKNVVDAIGAGDSFNAGFIFKYLKGSSLEECQIFGNLIGAISTTAPGGTTAFKDYKNTMKIAKSKFGYEEKE